jgi:hypothetical protein
MDGKWGTEQEKKLVKESGDGMWKGWERGRGQVGLGVREMGKIVSTLSSIHSESSASSPHQTWAWTQKHQVTARTGPCHNCAAIFAHFHW